MFVEGGGCSGAGSEAVRSGRSWRCACCRRVMACLEADRRGAGGAPCEVDVEEAGSSVSSIANAAMAAYALVSFPGSSRLARMDRNEYHADIHQEQEVGLDYSLDEIRPSP
jgi:hypothetical protein